VTLIRPFLQRRWGRKGPKGGRGGQDDLLARGDGAEGACLDGRRPFEPTPPQRRHQVQVGATGAGPPPDGDGGAPLTLTPPLKKKTTGMTATHVSAEFVRGAKVCRGSGALGPITGGPSAPPSRSWGQDGGRGSHMGRPPIDAELHEVAGGGTGADADHRPRLQHRPVRRAPTAVPHTPGGGVRGVGCLAPKVEHHPRADSLFTPTRRSVPTPRCSPALRPACDPLTKRWDRR